MFPDIVISLITRTELELGAKGFSPDQIRMATKRAVKWSETMVDKLPTSVKEEAFISFVSNRLSESEQWLNSLEEAARRRDYAKGITRAAKDNRLQEGFAKMGFPKVSFAQTWKESLDNAIPAWENRVTK